ncbi:MAG: Ig-like domain-containing protein [Paludibacter sp.]
MRKSHFLFILFLISFNLKSQAQQIANYGVEGWAAYTEGGRGGRIIRVTNLNASGTGSFADAITASGPRIVVFEVGGVINMNGSSKSIKNPYITIAGQTAPGKGITLINGGLSISTHDVILQHISIRPGASGHVVGSWEPDAMSTVGAYHVIIDHCSFTWAVDENCSASGDRFKGATPDEWRINTSHDVTISNNIIAEGLSTATHSKGEHSKGSLIHDNTSNIAILNNLYACNKDRNPLFKGGARGVIVNNYIYNPGSAAISFGLVDSEWTGYDYQTGRMSVVGNYMQAGPNTGSSVALIKIGNGPCEVYLSDNISNKPSGIVQNEYKGDLTKIVSTKPVWNDNIHTIPVADVQQNVLKNAGARPWDRDATDTRILNNMLTGTGSIINYETEVGGYPNYNPSNQTFQENEWNMDYMLKLSPDVFILTPDSGSLFMKDSVFTVESVINNQNDAVNYLELLVNGVSVGKVTQAPYKWDISIHNPGNYELVVVAAIDKQMKTSTKTLHIAVAGSSTYLKQNNSKILTFSSSPNPFRVNTNINYHLIQPSFINLGIYNSMGSKVDTLIDEFQTDGEYNIKWEPKKLPSGIYFSCLMVGSEVICNKMIYESFHSAL